MKKGKENNILLREIFQEEWEEAALIESICFPPREACQPDKIKDRVRTAASSFLVAYDQKVGRIAGFLNGIAVNDSSFRDDFFLDASLHTEEGKNVMLLGLDVRPEYRKQGLASRIMKAYIEKERKRGRERLILTCHDELVPFYERLGFEDQGVGASLWGGISWHDMVYMLI